MFDWHEISPDPTNKQAQVLLDGVLSDATRIEPISRMEMILDFCRDRSVLDIGAGEHDPAFYSDEGWEHGQIVKVAAKAVAVEINPTLCEHYKKAGFDFRCVDATSDADLGERFERIFIGDVIEHVNDPVALLEFAGRHLAPGGAVLVTTPNPFAPRVLGKRAKMGTRYVMANLEHTRWVSTSTMYEVVRRAGLELSALRWPMCKRRQPGLRKSWAIFAKRLALAVAPIERVFHEYAFELRRPA
ncbi:MAG: class I SAM-dependent methyltransferase [Caulobacteraceae bacterium]